MARLPLATIGDAYTNRYGWELLEEIVSVENRMAGQIGELEGARVLERAFADVGLREVKTSEFEILGWCPDNVTLEVNTSDHRPIYNSSHEVLALPGSPSADVEAKLVDIGGGVPENFQTEKLSGAVVLVSNMTPDSYERGIHRLEKYWYAVQAGAEGFVLRNHINGCLPLTGEVGWNERPGPIPAVGVSAEVGARLARCNAASSRRVRLTVECETERATSQNVEAVVGPDTTPEVLVTAHIDAHEISEGAGDNAVGSALVAELGRLLVPIEDQLDSRVRIVVFGSEEIGLYGSKHWRSHHTMNEIKCVVNVDGPALSEHVLLRSNAFADMRTVFEQIGEELDMPTVVNDEVNPHNDSWTFAECGVPAVMFGSTSPTDGQYWGHTHADTLDKLDRRNMCKSSVFLASVIMTLASDEYEMSHKSADELLASINKGTESALKARNDWPFN